MIRKRVPFGAHLTNHIIMAPIEPENTLSGNGKRVLLGENKKAATPERFLCKHDAGVCDKTGSFYLKGFPGNKYCKNHSTKYMVSNKRECHEADCSKKPCFNFQDAKQGKYCAGHKLKDMVNVVSKKCARQGCSKRASFNKEGERRGLFCADHRMPNMIPVEKRICTVACCWKSANYGDPDSHRGQRCAKHKTEDMVDLRNPGTTKCRFSGCSSWPSFGFPGQRRKKTHCAKHKLQDMVNLNNQKNQGQKRPPGGGGGDSSKRPRRAPPHAMLTACPLLADSPLPLGSEACAAFDSELAPLPAAVAAAGGDEGKAKELLQLAESVWELEDEAPPQQEEEEAGLWWCQDEPCREALRAPDPLPSWDSAALGRAPQGPVPKGPARSPTGVGDLPCCFEEEEGGELERDLLTDPVWEEMLEHPDRLGCGVLLGGDLLGERSLGGH